MKLSTLTKLKRHLGIPVDDLTKNEMLNLLLTGSSNYIEGQTARALELQSHSLKLSGDGTDMLVLPQYPILMSDGVPAISVLKVDDVDILAEIASGDIDVDDKTGILYRDQGWHEGRRNIEITFSAGYVLPGSDESGQETATTLPEDLELASIRLAARVYERSKAEGITSVSATSMSVNYKDSIDPEIVETIARHARVRIG